MAGHQRHPRRERLALVLVDDAPMGSGYLVDRQHVLTAAHVVDEGVVAVRMAQETDVLPATVIWRGSGPCDVAMLRLDAPLAGSRGNDPEWASHARSDLECEAIGYPKFQDEDVDGEGTAETAGFVGRLDPHGGLEIGRINAIYHSGSRPGEDWRGYSGAALFVQGLFVGVVTHADVDRLLAWPADRIAEERELAVASGKARVCADTLWPAEDQPLLRSLKTRKIGIPTTPQPAKLLEASYEVVPFDEKGRAEVLDLLEQLVADDDAQPNGVLVIVGPGGAGKTRLMLEWCRRMRARGWLAGFAKEKLANVEALVHGQTPRFVVLDYAEADPTTAAELLLAMVHRPDEPPMRVVLLARDAGPWLRAVMGKDGAVEDLVRAHPVHRLAPLYSDSADQRRGFEAAKAGFVDVAGLPGSAATVSAAAAPSGPALDRALYVHMQALLAVYGEGELASSLSPTEILERVLVHERRFWTQWFEKRRRMAAPTMLMEGAEQAAAALVLCGRAPDRGVARELFEVAVPDLEPSERQAIVECFADLYEEAPDKKGILPIEPDLLGETLVARVIERDAAEEAGLERWLGLPFGDRAPQGAVARALTVLTRLAGRVESRALGLEWMEWLLRERGRELVDRVDRTANEGRSDPPGVVLEQAIGAIEDVDLAASIGDAVPQTTVELREVRVSAFQVAVEGERRAGNADKTRIARFSNNLGLALSNLGRREEALRATQDAVDAYRELAKHRPGLFTRPLAIALNNLGNTFSTLERREDALEAAQQALDLYRVATADSSDASSLDLLASALTNVGMMQNGLGQRQEALNSTQEAIGIYRNVEDRAPGAFLPSLAGCLLNLGWMQSNLGLREEALRSTHEALDAFKRLAEQKADDFLPGLATALVDHGVSLRSVGRLEDAARATNKAVGIRRALAKRLPEAFMKDLSTALVNLGGQWGELGQREDALRAMQESVDIRRGLAADQPDVFAPDLAIALDGLGICLRDTGRQEDALQATQEAVGIRRALAQERPEAFMPDLARSLNNLGTRLTEMGKKADAQRVTQESVEIYQDLAARFPETFMPELAGGLNNLSNPELVNKFETRILRI